MINNYYELKKQEDIEITVPENTTLNGKTHYENLQEIIDNLDNTQLGYIKRWFVLKENNGKLFFEINELARCRNNQAVSDIQTFFKPIHEAGYFPQKDFTIRGKAYGSLFMLVFDQNINKSCVLTYYNANYDYNSKIELERKYSLCYKPNDTETINNDLETLQEVLKEYPKSFGKFQTYIENNHIFITVNYSITVLREKFEKLILILQNKNILTNGNYYTEDQKLTENMRENRFNGNEMLESYSHKIICSQVIINNSNIQFYIPPDE